MSPGYAAPIRPPCAPLGPADGNGILWLFLVRSASLYRNPLGPRVGGSSEERAVLRPRIVGAGVIVGDFLQWCGICKACLLTSSVIRDEFVYMKNLIAGFFLPKGPSQKAEGV